MLQLALKVLVFFFFFFSDLITDCVNELFSKNNNLFMDETLPSQLAEEPLGMEDDVSFDFLNLPNTLEYMSQLHPSRPQPSQPPPPPPPQQQQQPQHRKKLQQNHHHHLSDLFLTSSTTVPQAAQKSPVLASSQTLISSLPSQTLPASTSPILPAPQNAQESNVTPSSLQQRVVAPVCTVAPSQSAVLLHSAGVAPLAQQHNQMASLTFSNIHASVPSQQRINLQTSPATAAALQNSHIQLQLQALKNRQQSVKHSSVPNQLLTLQSMRQLPTDQVQQVSTTAACLPYKEVFALLTFMYLTHSLPKSTMVDLSIYVLNCQR
jgi:hypothetical protein